MKTILFNGFKAVAVVLLAVGSFMLVNSFGTAVASAAHVAQPGPVLFEYHPPLLETNPYDEVHVKNLDNWQVLTGTPCDPNAPDEIPCSILVPFANTTDGGTKIDPSVEIMTEETGTNIFRLDASPTSEYLDPINKEL